MRINLVSIPKNLQVISRMGAMVYAFVFLLRCHCLPDRHCSNLTFLFLLLLMPVFYKFNSKLCMLLRANLIPIRLDSDTLKRYHYKYTILQQLKIEDYIYIATICIVIYIEMVILLIVLTEFLSSQNRVRGMLQYQVLEHI